MLVRPSYLLRGFRWSVSSIDLRILGTSMNYFCSLVDSMTYLISSFWRSPFLIFEKRVTEIHPSQKGHQQNCQVNKTWSTNYCRSFFTKPRIKITQVASMSKYRLQTTRMTDSFRFGIKCCFFLGLLSLRIMGFWLLKERPIMNMFPFPD